ncbi:MAG: prenyltransferase [Syntrophorhabdaceae bacterium]
MENTIHRLSFAHNVKAWIQLSRPPFHTVGVFPFFLGTILAWRLDHVFNLPLFILGTIAVVFIMLCTYYTGEYSDVFEDRLSEVMDRNAFSGGTQAVIHDLIPQHYARVASYIALGLTVVTGLIIQFVYNTGGLTIPLGIVGILSGWLYSKMPIRWVARGVGEILIGLCYGWLPVAVSYYLQTGTINPMIHWMSIPIACTIFNVILINEFPDHPADVIAKKSNLLVRFGKETGVLIYIGVTIIGCAGYLVSVMQGLPKSAYIYYAPTFLICVVLCIMMGAGKYRNKKLLETMCALTIVTNLGSSLAYIMTLYFMR